MECRYLKNSYLVSPLATPRNKGFILQNVIFLQMKFYMFYAGEFCVGECHGLGSTFKGRHFAHEGLRIDALS